MNIKWFNILWARKMVWGILAWKVIQFPYQTVINVIINVCWLNIIIIFRRLHNMYNKTIPRALDSRGNWNPRSSAKNQNWEDIKCTTDYPKHQFSSLQYIEMFSKFLLLCIIGGVFAFVDGQVFRPGKSYILR